MRPSASFLGETPVRLAALEFPRVRDHISRTRLAYIHLDHLLHFAKIDRDGRIDGYIVAYLPDETALLFFQHGELVTAVALTDRGRKVVPLAAVLELLDKEQERGELAFCEAPAEQLAWMYEASAGTARTLPVDAREPARVFHALQHERFSGVLELISDGRVSYFHFADGQYRSGYCCGKAPDVPMAKFVEAQFAAHEDGSMPALFACTFAARDDLPAQAPPALIEQYRDLFWRVAETAEEQAPGEATRRAQKVRDELAGAHPALKAIGNPRDRDPVRLVTSPAELTGALAGWAQGLLEQLEVMAPGVAPEVLKTATREQRFMLQKAGFYERLPWTVRW